MALLIIIYVAFISLGLPDSLLGSAWPSMYKNLGVAISGAGVISMIIAGGTIVSSLFSDRLIKRFGTGKVTFVSVFMTAAALIGISLSDSFILICVWAVPMGLGAGSVDAGLNNFVALHYKAKHMSWLHCFWGIGASAGPVVISFCLVQWSSWRMGYRSIGIFQLCLVAVLLFTIALWKKYDNPTEIGEVKQKSLSIPRLIALPKAKQTLIAFFCYCALESTVGLWGSSYLVGVRGISAETAASWISIYYIGITLGRLLSGFLNDKMTHHQLIKLGQLLIVLGVVILMLPFGGYILLAGFLSIGMGCAPIYPSLLHETPDHFGSEHSQSIMGMQMACAYVGSTFMPPLFGFLAAKIGYQWFPVYVGLILILMIIMVRVVYLKKDIKDEFAGR